MLVRDPLPPLSLPQLELVHVDLGDLEGDVDVLLVRVGRAGQRGDELLGVVVELHLEVVPLGHVAEHDGLVEREAGGRVRGLRGREEGIALRVVAGPPPLLLPPRVMADLSIDEVPAELLLGLGRRARDAVVVELVDLAGDVLPVPDPVPLDAVQQVDVFPGKKSNCSCQCFN